VDDKNLRACASIKNNDPIADDLMKDFLPFVPFWSTGTSFALMLKRFSTLNNHVHILCTILHYYVVTETETNQIEPDCMCELHNNSASSRIISLTMATRESEYYRDCNHNSVGLHFRPRESSCKKHTIHLQFYVLLYLWLHIPCMMQFLYKLGLHGENNVDVSKLNCLFNTIMIIYGCCNRFLSAWVEKRKNTMWWYLVQNS